MSTAEIATPVAVNHWIDGKSVEATSGRSGAVTNPATGQVIAEVGFASVEEVDRAVASAKAAAHEWRITPLSRRAEVMFRLHGLVSENRRRFAEIVSRENGKTVADALGEVARGLENLEFACGVPNMLKGGYTEQASRGVDVYQIRQPLGVVAGITPFNFPMMVPLWMMPNAIACGNAFILKPSEKVPSAVMLLAELAAEAGVPPGVFNIIQGDKVAVDRLLDHPDVKAISFVGSTPIARHIYQVGTQKG
jgi:malonate-semialdehyde dehydrogenase (acetylating)/methylmalonate-semialdehyde dehydrogenase